MFTLFINLVGKFIILHANKFERKLSLLNSFKIVLASWWVDKIMLDNNVKRTKI